MNRDDIIYMAEKAGITSELIISGWGEHWIDIPVQLERFANLVAAKERDGWQLRLKILGEQYDLVRKHRDVLLAAQLDAIRTKEQE